jgi:molecular chaperone GrpE
VVPENDQEGTEDLQPEQEAEPSTHEVPVEDAAAGLEAELARAKEDVLRAQAEMQNVRRRAQMDVEKAHKFGQEKLISDLLAVVDNLERALASMDANDENTKAVLEGVELTLKSLVDTLKRHNVETVDPEGQPFDPALHQAMTAVENPDLEPNTVMNVFQKGYTLHGRLIRPAMVVVSKAPATEASK